VYINNILELRHFLGISTLKGWFFIGQLQNKWIPSIHLNGVTCASMDRKYSAKEAGHLPGGRATHQGVGKEL
jgi:hypothetical protein